jgi:hypothetical protein
MKTKSIIGLSIATLLFTSSCKKEAVQSPLIRKSFDITSAIRDINTHYCDYMRISRAPSAIKTIVADAGAGWSVGEAASIFGPWGAFAGALIGGVAGSLIYIYALPAPPPGSSTGGVYMQNLNNPYDAVGLAHNSLCAEILSEDQTLYVNNGIVNEQALFKRLEELAVVYYNKTCIGPVNKMPSKTIADIPFTLAQFHQGINPSANPALTTDKDAQYIIDLYTTNLPFVANGKAGVLNYTLAYENAIAKSNYSLQTKTGLFCFLAIARNSYMFWNQN